MGVEGEWVFRDQKKKNFCPGAHHCQTAPDQQAHLSSRIVALSPKGREVYLSQNILDGAKGFLNAINLP